MEILVLICCIVCMGITALIGIRAAYLLKRINYVHTCNALLERQIEAINRKQMDKVTRLLMGVLVILVSDETLRDKIKEFSFPDSQ